jgi:hypothetical protein
VVELGFDIEHSPTARGVKVTAVREGTPAEAAGLRAEDLVVSVDGRSVRESAAARGDVYLERRPGDPVELEVLRAGSETPVVYRAIFRGRTLPTSLPALVRLLLGTTVLFPFVLLAVALPVLFFAEDRNAWLLAALFLCLTAAPGFRTASPGWRAVALVRRPITRCSGLLARPSTGSSPSSRPLAAERRAQWLKWAFWWPVWPSLLRHPRGDMAAGGGRRLVGEDAARRLAFGYSYGAIALGLASLLANAWRPQTPDARCKIRWSHGEPRSASCLRPPSSLRSSAGRCLTGSWRWASWRSSPPASFAYAVVVHRVLSCRCCSSAAPGTSSSGGLRVLLVLLALAANALFALSFTRLFEVDATLATSAGVGFGLALASISAPGIRRATGRIDRAFFRDAYDARVVLEELAARIRTVSSQGELGPLGAGPRALRPGDQFAFSRS